MQSFALLVSNFIYLLHMFVRTSSTYYICLSGTMRIAKITMLNFRDMSNLAYYILVRTSDKSTGFLACFVIV
jgi:hypothetical protein